MESTDNIQYTKKGNPDEESVPEIKRWSFEAKAKEIADKFDLSSLQVLEHYATKMDKHFDKFNSNEEALDVIFSSPVTEDMYWDSVETTLALNKANLNSAIFEELATKDPLTGLDNRRSMETHLEKMAANFERRPSAFAFILIDLDNFKSINDTFGHDVGDKVLKAVTVEVKNHIRPTDLACRIGGEEIGVVVTGDRSIATMLAERIRRSIEEIEVDTLGINKSVRESITASIGVAEYCGGNNHTETVASLLKSADIALYEAKTNGKNQVKVA